MQNPLHVLASRYFMVGGFLVTAVGTTVALKRDAPWIAFLLLIPLTLSSLCAMWTWYGEARAANLRYEREKKEHARTKEEAERVASEALSGISLLLRQYALGNAAIVIRRSIQLMNRMRNLEASWGASPQVRKFTASLQKLYGSIKLPSDAAEHIREGDCFVLVQSGKDAIRHKVAMLRVHQPPNADKGTVHLVVDEIFNDETTSALITLTEAGDKSPRGFTLQVPFETRVFDDFDLAGLDTLLDTMVQHLNEVFLEEVHDG